MRHLHLPFQHLFAIEILELQVVGGGILQRFLGDQADQFALQYRGAFAGGLFADQVHHLRHGSLAEVGEVHGDLRFAVHQEAGALHEGQAAGGSAHFLGYVFGDLYIVRVQVNVIRDQGLSGANGYRAGAAQFSRPKVGLARRVSGNGVPDAFIFAAAHVF